MQSKKKYYKKTKKKVKIPEDINEKGYDEYGDRKNQKIDYEKDKPPHW
jgi:hypothetical protein